MIRLLGIVMLFLSMLGWVSPVSAQDGDDRTGTTARLSFCIVSGDANLVSWEQTNKQDVLSVLDAAHYSTELKVRIAPCNDSMPDTSCAALTGELFCRSAALDRIQTSAAWLSDSYVNSGLDGYEEFRLASKIEPGVEINFSALPASTENDTTERIRAIYRIIDEGEDASSDALMRRKVRLQRAIASIVITSVIGHELYHMNGQRCPVIDASKVETSGLLKVIERIQVSDELFKAAYPDPNEYKADRCAFRQISRLNFSDLSASDEFFARRAAADLMSFIFGIGLRVPSQTQEEKFRTVYLDSYIMPPLRITLFASEIAPSNTEFPVCGRSAQLFASALGDYYNLLPGDGLVPDDLLDQFPDQMERSFTGEPWSPASFSCNQ